MILVISKQEITFFEDKTPELWSAIAINLTVRDSQESSVLAMYSYPCREREGKTPVVSS
jgi:hypothetical protein